MVFFVQCPDAEVKLQTLPVRGVFTGVVFGTSRQMFCVPEPPTISLVSGVLIVVPSSGDFARELESSY